MISQEQLKDACIFFYQSGEMQMFRVYMKCNGIYTYITVMCTCNKVMNSYELSIL